MNTFTVNSGKPPKKKKLKPRGKPFQKGAGVDQRINRAGAPVRGQSYAETVKRLSDMTNEELADFFGRNTPLGQQFLQQPRDVVSRDVVIGRAIVTLENDFDARGFGQLTDRSEGKPPQPITGDKDNPLKVIIEYANSEDNPAPATSSAEEDQE